MNNQSLDFAPAADAKFLGHLLGRGKAYDEVPEMLPGPFFRLCGEAEDIRRLVDSPVVAVQLPHGPVVDIGDGNALGAGHQALLQLHQQFTDGSVARSAQLAPGGPIDLEIIHL